MNVRVERKNINGQSYMLISAPINPKIHWVNSLGAIIDDLNTIHDEYLFKARAPKISAYFSNSRKP